MENKRNRLKRKTFWDWVSFTRICLLVYKMPRVTVTALLDIYGPMFFLHSQTTETSFLFGRTLYWAFQFENPNEVFPSSWKVQFQIKLKFSFHNSSMTIDTNTRRACLTQCRWFKMLITPHTCLIPFSQLIQNDQLHNRLSILSKKIQNFVFP